MAKNSNSNFEMLYDCSCQAARFLFKTPWISEYNGTITTSNGISRCLLEVDDVAGQNLINVCYHYLHTISIFISPDLG